jgi:hypothetical protein
MSTTNVTLSNTISPDGTLNALKINETTNSSQHYASAYAASVVSGNMYTVSFYIKKGTYDLVTVYTQSSIIRAALAITFSTESAVGSGDDFILGSNFMEAVGNGWYRVGFSCTPISTGTSITYLTVKDINNYLGQASNYTEYWGFQLEQQSYATSYIPTSGSTVTRNQDVCTNGGSLATINSTSGTLYFEGAVLANDGTNRVITLSDASNWNNRAFLRYNVGANSITYRYIVGGSIKANLTHTLSDATTINKIAIKWELNNFKLYVNGLNVGQDLSGSVMAANSLDTLNFNDGLSTLPFQGKVKDLRTYNTALTDAELTILTTI